MNNNKTNIDFKVFLLQNGITITELGDITGLNPRSISNQLSANKKLPTWAKTMMYGYEMSKANTDTPVMVLDGVTTYNCGCKHEGKLFRRDKGCKMDIKEHRA